LLLISVFKGITKKNTVQIILTFAINKIYKQCLFQVSFLLIICILDIPADFMMRLKKTGNCADCVCIIMASSVCAVFGLQKFIKFIFIAPYE
jgi:hypothetical protein